MGQVYNTVCHSHFKNNRAHERIALNMRAGCMVRDNMAFVFETYSDIRTNKKASKKTGMTLVFKWIKWLHTCLRFLIAYEK